jgi:hypothetical protein
LERGGKEIDGNSEDFMFQIQDIESYKRKVNVIKMNFGGRRVGYGVRKWQDDETILGCHSGYHSVLSWNDVG